MPEYSNIKTLHATPATSSLDVLLSSRLKHIASHGYDIYGYSADRQINGESYSASFISKGYGYIESRHLTREFDLLADFKYFIEAYKLLRRERPMIVNTYGPKPGVFVRIAARLAGVPVVIHTSWGFYFPDGAPWYRKWPVLAAEYLAAKFCDHVFSVNRDDMELMIKLKFKGAGGIEYLGNGTNLEQFSPSKIGESEMKDARERLGIGRDGFVFGMVGRLCREKGIYEFIDAAREQKKRNPDITFVCVGHLDNSKGSGLKPEEVEALQRDGVITFLEPRPHHEMPLVYSLFDVVVLPSYREGFPRSLVEAAAMGKPIITTDVRGCKEAVDDGVNGLLVKVRDHRSLATAMSALAMNTALCKRMGERGREKALALFNERVLASRIAARYSKILSQKGLLASRYSE